MRRIIEDPNQLNIEFPEENKMVADNKPEALDVEKDKEIDLNESQKAQEEARSNIYSSLDATEYEREDPGAMYKVSEQYKEDKNKEWKEKEKGRIFDNATMSVMRGIINDFKDGIVSDIAFNGDFSNKSDALDFDKIKSRAKEHLLRGNKERANSLNRGMGVLRRISNIKKMLEDLKHQKFIDYIDNLKTDKGVTCDIIVQSKQYDQLMDIIRQNRR